jgi:hypothetical protein
MLELSIGLAEVAHDVAERLDDRQNLMILNPSDTLQEEIDFLERIRKKVGAYRDLVGSHMRAAMSPRAPYSALARAWATAFIAEE